MARIDALPSIEIILGLKGILDFYLWRGLPCVRAWPRYRPSRQTDASAASALLFGTIIKAYALLANQTLLAYRELALDQPRTARDIMVTGVFGNLHEASMSDFLDALIIIRDATVALTDLLDALHSIGSDRLDVDVHASVLPPLAASTTNQGLIYARLGIIDDLADALESNALDRLLVRGMDQLFSFKDTLAVRGQGAISGANGYIDSPSPPATEIWIVTTVSARDNTTPTTAHAYSHLAAALTYAFFNEVKAFPIGELSTWGGLVLLKQNETVRASFAGGLGGDQVRVYLNGYRMTLET